MMNHIAVIGSRDFNDQGYMWELLDTICLDHGPCALVSGGAKGADTLAERYADSKGYDKIIHLAEWEKYKPADPNRKNPAGMIRNKLIVRDANILVAFWDMKSPGSAGCIELAKKKPMDYIYIVDYINRKVVLT